MPSVTPIQGDFSAGEVAPDVQQRSTLEARNRGVKTLTNFTPDSRGPAIRRAGFRYLGTVGVAGEVVAYSTFVQNTSGQTWIRDDIGNDWVYIGPSTNASAALAKDNTELEFVSFNGNDSAKQSIFSSNGGASFSNGGTLDRAINSGFGSYAHWDESSDTWYFFAGQADFGGFAVFKSTDDAQTWTFVRDVDVNLSQQTTSFFAASEDYWALWTARNTSSPNAGYFSVTTDKGINWTQIEPDFSSLAQNTAISTGKLVYNENNDRWVFIGRRTSGGSAHAVYTRPGSTLASTGWTIRHQFNLSGGDTMKDIVQFGDTIVLGVGSSSNLVDLKASYDGGLTWTDTATGSGRVDVRTDVAMDAGLGAGVLVGANSELWQYLDGTWTDIASDLLAVVPIGGPSVLGQVTVVAVSRYNP